MISKKNSYKCISTKDIVNSCINEVAARIDLSKTQYYYFKCLYNYYNEKGISKSVDDKQFLEWRNVIISEFDMVAPYYKYCEDDSLYYMAKYLEEDKKWFREESNYLIDNGHINSVQWYKLSNIFFKKFYAENSLLMKNNFSAEFENIDASEIDKARKNVANKLEAIKIDYQHREVFETNELLIYCIYPEYAKKHLSAQDYLLFTSVFNFFKELKSYTVSFNYQQYLKWRTEIASNFDMVVPYHKCCENESLKNYINYADDFEESKKPNRVLPQKLLKTWQDDSTLCSGSLWKNLNKEFYQFFDILSLGLNW